RDVSRQIVSNNPLLATKIRSDHVELKESWKKAGEWIDVLIAPSKIMRRMYVLNGFPEKKIRLSTYGVRGPRDKTPKEPRIDSNTTFGYIGRLHPSKGIDVLINAFKEIKDENIRL